MSWNTWYALRSLFGMAREFYRKEGLIAVAVPNVLCYPIRLGFLLAKISQLHPESGVMDKTHLRFYSFKSAAALLEIIRTDTNLWFYLRMAQYPYGKAVGIYFLPGMLKG